MKQITVTIGPDGNVKLEASGFAGNDCLAATKAIEEAIGTPGDRTRKVPEATAGVAIKARQ